MTNKVLKVMIKIILLMLIIQTIYTSKTEALSLDGIFKAGDNFINEGKTESQKNEAINYEEFRLTTNNIGSVLSVTTGTWAASATYAYRWEQSTNGTTWTTISGATANNYTLVAGNVGKTVRAVVIATGSGTTKEANSNVLGPITAT